MKFRKSELDMILTAIQMHVDEMREMLTDEIQERLGVGSTPVDVGVSAAIDFLEQYRTAHTLKGQLEVGRESMVIHEHEMDVVREAFETFDDSERDMAADAIMELMGDRNLSSDEKHPSLNAILQKDRDRTRLYARLNHEQ